VVGKVLSLKLASFQQTAGCMLFHYCPVISQTTPFS
jgi:hypothetical protein